MSGFINSLPALTGIAGILFGAGGLATALFERKKRKADTVLVESQAAINYSTLANAWIDRLESKVRSLEEKIQDLEKTVDIYEAEIHHLTNELRNEREKNDSNVSSVSSGSIDYTVAGHIAVGGSGSNESQR